MRKRKKRRVTRRAPTAHYSLHRERAREFVHERLMYWNGYYFCTYNRVAIRNQVSRWGSCSSKRNLNFNYRIMFLPIHLADYIIVHELCHLIELNHSPAFWAQVEKVLPDYVVHMQELRAYPIHTIGVNHE